MAFKQIEMVDEETGVIIDTWTMQRNHQVYVDSTIEINGEKYLVVKISWDMYDREQRVVRKLSKEEPKKLQKKYKRVEGQVIINFVRLEEIMEDEMVTQEVRSKYHAEKGDYETLLHDADLVSIEEIDLEIYDADDKGNITTFSTARNIKIREWD